MFDRDKAFEIPDDGILIEGGVHVISGSQTPDSLSINPTNPTVFIQSNGTLWKHSGTGAWSRIGSLNFSFHKVDQPVVIPNGQQMLTLGSFEVTANGSFQIEPEGKFRIKEN